MSKPAVLTPVFATAHALRASGDADAALPRRIKILDWGENKGRTTGSRILVNEVTTAALTANQERFAHDLVELDFEHQSFKAHPNFQAHPRHSAAHGKIEVVAGDGVYLSALSYTPKGQEHAANYPDVSAVAHCDAAGNLVFVSSVALTQTGDVAGMTFAEAMTALSGSLPTQATTTQNTNTMDSDKYRDLLIKLLGLVPADGEESVSDEQLTAAATAFAEKPIATPLSVVTKNDDDDGDGVTALSARLDKMERDNLVQRASLDGKVIPLSAAQIDELKISTLSAMIDKIEATVPMGDHAGKEKPAENVAALSADEKSICKQLGISADDFRAAK